MAALSRRLAALESLFGPVVVEATPTPAPTPEPTTIDWSPADRAILREHDRGRAQQLRNMIEAEPNHPGWTAELAGLRAAAVDRCKSCEAWPMEKIQFGRDGAVRCGSCSSLHEWLPPERCDYFGHPATCRCDYDPVGELQWRWFWPLIVEECQQMLLSWYGGLAA